MVRNKNKDVNNDVNLEELKMNIYNEIHDDLVKDIKDDLDSQFGVTYRNDLKESVTKEIIDDIKEKVNKDELKLSRRKSFKIFRLYIYMILLFILCLYLIFILYTGKKLPFNLSNIKLDNQTTTTVVTTTTTTTTTRSQAWLNENYGYLLKDLNITKLNYYTNGLVVSNLDNETKLSFAFDQMDQSKVVSEDIIHKLSSDDLEEVYAKLYGNEVPYEPIKFNGANLTFAYSESSKEYIALGELKNTSLGVIRKVKNINQTSDAIVFTVVVGYLKDNQLYNINDLTNSLGTYEDNIDNYINSLSSVKVVFKCNDNNYYFDSIVKN